MQGASGVVDTSNLLSVCRAGEVVDLSLLRELLGFFIDQNQRRMTEATRAAEIGDREALRDLAHAVRGSAALLGAGRLHDLASALERDPLPHEIHALKSAVAALSGEFAAVLTALRSRHPEAFRD
jgi:HPt (histidine-containing phosphotransfer) domain-containing protein